MNVRDTQALTATQYDALLNDKQQRESSGYIHNALVATQQRKKKKLFSDYVVYAMLALSFGLAPSGGIHMQVVKGKASETQYAICPGAREKRREVALGRP
jgi:hypothetical protein